jgi:hypothetical protein
MIETYRKRRIFIAVLVLIIFIFVIIINTPNITNQTALRKPVAISDESNLVVMTLSKLATKGRAPKTGYTRAQFGDGWEKVNGCDTRNIILNRDMTDVKIDEKCDVLSGVLNDPYTGKMIYFTRGGDTSSSVQIDHVVALSDAWQTGAQQFTIQKRIELANDPLELLAASGSANIQKSDGDAATWLPSNKSFRCSYIARQIAVKLKYSLWVTQAEHDSMLTVLDKCPNQLLPSK